MPREPDHTRPRETTPETQYFRFTNDELRAALVAFLAQSGTRFQRSAKIDVQTTRFETRPAEPGSDFSGIAIEVKIP